MGSAVEAWTPGQRVTLEPDLPCWTCKMCTSGRENLCENLQFFGCGYRQGGMADYFTIAADRLHPVPDSLDDHAAALIEPLSTPVHAVRLAGDVAGRAVAVLGPARSGCSPWRCSVRTGREKSSAPIRIPLNAPGPWPSAPARSSTHAHPTSPGK